MFWFEFHSNFQDHYCIYDNWRTHQNKNISFAIGCWDSRERNNRIYVYGMISYDENIFFKKCLTVGYAAPLANRVWHTIIPSIKHVMTFCDSDKNIGKPKYFFEKQSTNHDIMICWLFFKKIFSHLSDWHFFHLLHGKTFNIYFIE